MSRIKMFSLLGAILVAAVPALGTPPGAASPLAEEQLGGTVLTILPRIAYDGAVLRVSGPDGYALSERFNDGAPLTVDLSAAAERSVRAGKEEQNAELRADLPALPDGRYNYEVVFTDAAGASQVHSGLFFVEGGSLVSREAKRAELAGVRENLSRLPRERNPAASGPRSEPGPPGADPAGDSLSDYLLLYDLNADGRTVLYLDSDPGSLYWFVQNVDGDLDLYEFSPGYTTRATFERGGDVGMGTTAPARALHVIENGSNFELRLESGSGQFVDFQQGTIGLFLTHTGVEADSSFELWNDAPANAFVVRNFGIGMGVAEPEASLHVQPATNDGNVLVRAATGGPYSLFAIENDDGAFFRITNGSGIMTNGSWTFSSTSIDNFVISSQGNPGSEFSMQPDGDLTIAGSLSQMSSRASKENLAPVDGRAVLEKVAALPVLEWNYIKDGSQVRHVGAMAEDFHAAFGLNDSRRTISVMDASGVALAAIQGLHAEVTALREALDSRDAEIDRLREEQAELARRLVALAGGGS